MIFRNITYVALTNKMADTCVRLCQSRVQARPVRFGQDGCTMYTHCLRCMAWIALTNNMAEIFRQLYASARVSMSKICNRYLAKIAGIIVICVLITLNAQSLMGIPYMVKALR